MFFMEVSLGQLMQTGGIGSWDIFPALKGKNKVAEIKFQCHKRPLCTFLRIRGKRGKVSIQYSVKNKGS